MLGLHVPLGIKTVIKRTVELVMDFKVTEIDINNINKERLPSSVVCERKQ